MAETSTRTVWLDLLRCVQCARAGAWQPAGDAAVRCGGCGACFAASPSFVDVFEAIDSTSYADIASRYGELFREIAARDGPDPAVYYSKTLEQEADEFFAETALDPDRLDGLRILDAGAGMARLTRFLAERGAHCVALDLHDYLRELSRVDRGGDGAPYYVRGSVQAIPFGDCFDLVWCDGVLSYVPDPIVAIGELQRVTKPGGRLFFWVHTAVRSSPWLAIARGARRLPRFAREPVLDALALTRRAWRRVRRGSAKRSKQEGLHIRDWSIPPAIRPVPQTQLAAIARRNGWSIVRERIEPATSYYLLERSAEDGKTSNGDRAER